MRDVAQSHARIVLLLVAAFFVLRSCLLVYPDLNMTYPFLVPDSYDWIANGLSYGGYTVSCSLRPPALPLLIAVLERVNLLNLLPAVNQCALFCLLLVSYRMLASRYGSMPALMTTLILFCNHFLLNISLYVLADLYALLFILLGFQFYALAADDERRYVSCTLFLFLSFFFQHAVVFVVPALIAHYLAFRRRAGIGTLCRACLPVLVLAGGWLAYKKARWGSFLTGGVQQVDLLRLHTDSVALYLVTIAAVLSLPVTVAVLFGMLLSISSREERRGDFLRAVAFVSAAWFVFWVLLYDWNDRRFVLYLIFFLAPFLALALGRMLSSLPVRHRFGTIVVGAVYLLLLAGSSFCYESAFELGTLKLTPRLSIKFPVRMDPATSRSTMAAATFSIVRERRGFNQMNLTRLYDLRRAVDYAELARLSGLRREMDGKSKAGLCVAYDHFEGYRWYIDKNKYGNLFKKVMNLYPDCDTPDLWIVAGRLRSSP
jgi:hypothetical protein